MFTRCRSEGICYLGCNGPLVRYASLRVVRAPGMPGMFSPPPRVSDPDMHHGTCVTQVPWCMPGTLTSGFLWSWWRGNRSRHSLRIHNPQLYVSSKRPIADGDIQDATHWNANFVILMQFAEWTDYNTFHLFSKIMFLGSFDFEEQNVVEKLSLTNYLER